MKIPGSLSKYIDRELLSIQTHPLSIVKELLVNSFKKHTDIGNLFEDREHVVSVKDNFDDLLFEESHVARRPSESFFLSNGTLLRTHLTSRDGFYVRQGINKFLNVGKVFRRDEIDAAHLPVFHQFEGVYLYDTALPRPNVLSDLQTTITQVFKDIFGPDAMVKWSESQFPFTDPSVEAEVWFNGRWLELLGAGVLRRGVLKNFGVEGRVGYAFGMGLERIAMMLFDIPDIRWFWSTDDRFLSQFEPGHITKFKPFSNHPPIYRDLSFWLPANLSIENYAYDIMKEVARDDLESVKKFDRYEDAKTGRVSETYRLVFRSLDEAISADKVGNYMSEILSQLTSRLNVQGR